VFHTINAPFVTSFIRMTVISCSAGCVLTVCVFSVHCVDAQTSAVRSYRDTWLRWMGPRVEYCHCAIKGRERCHIVPVISECYLFVCLFLIQNVIFRCVHLSVCRLTALFFIELPLTTSDDYYFSVLPGSCVQVSGYSSASTWRAVGFFCVFQVGVV